MCCVIFRTLLWICHVKTKFSTPPFRTYFSVQIFINKYNISDNFLTVCINFLAFVVGIALRMQNYLRESDLVCEIFKKTSELLLLVAQEQFQMVSITGGTGALYMPAGPLSEGVHNRMVIKSNNGVFLYFWNMLYSECVCARLCVCVHACVVCAFLLPASLRWESSDYLPNLCSWQLHKLSFLLLYLEYRHQTKSNTMFLQPCVSLFMQYW